MNNVANPKYIKNPQVSVNVVNITADANAGSIFRNLSVTGTKNPIVQANAILPVIARNIIIPRNGLPCNKSIINPVNIPNTAPFITPTVNSFITNLKVSFGSNSPSAIPLIVTARVCVPAFPPIPATIGIAAANITTLEIVLENKLTVVDAINAVIKFTNNQGNLRLTENKNVESIFSSSETPPNFKISSVFSS